MGRSPCCVKEGLNRGAWTATEDRILTEYIKVHGEGKWRNLPKKAGLKRCGKSCRLRWLNYLRPDIKRGNITHDEEELIIRLHKLLGNRWSLIAGRLPGRTDNEIKNYWNTNIGKKISSKSRIQFTERSDSRSINRRPSSDNSPPVLRVKPSRCTKVFIHTEPPKTDTVQEPAAGQGQKANRPNSLPAAGSGAEVNSSDFMMDFEIDANFLSEFLNSDFSQLCDFDNGVEADNATEAPVLLKNEEAQQTPNLSSIDSFLNFEMDWFC